MDPKIAQEADIHRFARLMQPQFEQMARQEPSYDILRDLIRGEIVVFAQMQNMGTDYQEWPDQLSTWKAWQLCNPATRPLNPPDGLLVPDKAGQFELNETELPQLESLPAGAQKALAAIDASPKVRNSMAILLGCHPHQRHSNNPQPRSTARRLIPSDTTPPAEHYQTKGDI